jgi:hypothetical protein
MRTTVAIDDELLIAARRLAQQRNQTLGQTIEAALRRMLADCREQVAAPPVPIFTGGTGLRPGVDLDSNRAIHELLDEGLDLDQRR